MGLIEKTSHMDYWNVSHGALRKTTTEDDPMAEKREYTTRDGEKKVIYEIVKKGVSGYIDKVEITDGKFGKQFLVYVKDVDEFCIQMPWDSSEAMSICEKLRGVDIAKEVEILPYHFVPKGSTKVKRGVNLIQGDTKIKNYYVVFDADGKVVEYKHGLPNAEGNQTMETEDWKILFAQQRKFFRDEVVYKFPFIDVDETPEPEKKEKKEDKDDLPF